MDSSVAWRGIALFQHCDPVGGDRRRALQHPFSNKPPGWFDVLESNGPGSMLSRSFSEARPGAPGDRQDFVGGNDAWESTCPSMKVIAFPLLQ
jgi:hypothetical protein